MLKVKTKVGILGSPAEVLWSSLYNMVPRCMSHTYYRMGPHGTINFIKTSAELPNIPTNERFLSKGQWTYGSTLCLSTDSLTL